jgi:DnaJ-class molecular chaperone
MGKVIPFPRRIICTNCRGNGWVWVGHRKDRCPACSGSGTQPASTGGGPSRS